MKYERTDLILDTHTQDRLYLTSILAVQYLKICLHNDNNEVM